MASVDSNRALSKPSDRPQDALDAVTYLELVKSHLQINHTALHSFLLQVKHLSEYQELGVSWDRDRRSQEFIIEMAKILKFYPKLVFGLNALLPRGQRLECSTTVKEVRFFVLVDSSGARIIRITYSKHPPEFTDQSLRQTVIFEERWAPFLKDNSDRDWSTCVSELLRFILDDPSTDPFCSRRAYRCLRELAILPPSSLIHNVEHASFPPVKMAGGGYTDIYMGYVGNTRVCLRVLKPKTDAENMAKNFCTEVLVWSQLRHPNILPFLGASIDLFAFKLCFVTPWIPNGNLMEYLKVNPDHDRYISVCDIVEGIEYLHTRDPPVAHRDIKGSNVLVRDDGVCYLADFGLSSIEEEHKLVQSSPNSFKGSLNWAAPEIFCPPSSGERNLRAADVYALACTIYEIYMGVPPHWGKPPLVVYKLVDSDTERLDLPPVGKWTEQELSLWWLVDLCWLANPHFRPDISLVKDYLQDIGTFKPRSMQHHDSLLVSDGAAQKDFVNILNGIKQWLDQELNLKTNLSPHQPHLVDEFPEVLEDKGTDQMPAEEPNGLMQMTIQAFRRPHGSLQLDTSGIPAVSSSNQPASFGKFQGLFTPDTPSIPLEALCLQREYGPSPGPPPVSLPKVISVSINPDVLTPPSTPFESRIHSHPSCAVVGKSTMVVLRTEVQKLEANVCRSPSPFQLSAPVRMPKSAAAPLMPVPAHSQRRPIETGAQLFEKNTSPSPSPYQPAAQAPVPKPKALSLVTPAHRHIKPGGPRTYTRFSSYCPSPLSECTPLIVRPTNRNPNSSLAPRGPKFLDDATTPSASEGSELSPLILRTSPRQERSLGLLPASSSIVVLQNDHDDEHRSPRFRHGQ